MSNPDYLDASVETGCDPDIMESIFSYSQIMNLLPGGDYSRSEAFAAAQIHSSLLLAATLNRVANELSDIRELLDQQINE